jgi:pimeloyl-ACP methyl ester carboxylesterase
MKKLRKYGKAPFSLAVIHGGPGAPGEMAPVARELESRWGVLEPLQKAKMLKGQIEELKTVLEKNGDPPILLIGFSWGAWLSFIFTANYPTFVKKLILIGSGPYEEKYATNIMKTRLSRLTEEERSKAYTLMKELNGSIVREKNKLFAQFGRLISKADLYNPLPHDDEVLEYQYGIYQSVWEDAKILRRSGKLLELGKQIKCPVVAIHGDYDPHPPEGIKIPLSSILVDFKFVLIKDCGHYPWVERKARSRFYSILKSELD